MTPTQLPGHLSPRLVLVVLVLVGIIAAVFIGLRLNAHHKLENFLSPSPVPSELRVLQSRGTLFNSYYHFAGPPAVIVSVLQSKGLLEVPTEPPASSDVTGFSAREQTKHSWDWWQPSALSKPRFFHLYHKSETGQGWNEGWWINEATNEAYAYFIGG
jgi:hypothetical protein